MTSNSIAKKPALQINDVDVFVFDFDGVLTNNNVYLNQNGEEFVCCSRSDGLAFDVLRSLGKPVYILSTERNSVVAARAEKLKVKAIYGKFNKVESLYQLANKNGYELANMMYVGNDINDFKAMQLCGYSACPADSHDRIKEVSNHVLTANGGDAVVRDLLENVFRLDLISILYEN